MAEKGGPETRGKGGRPVTLPGLYQLLQQWQPPEEADGASRQQATAAAASGATHARGRRRALPRATSGSMAPRSSERLDSWPWAESVSQSQHSHTRRSTRRRKLSSRDAGPARRRRDKDETPVPLVRLVRRALRLIKLRAHTIRRKRRSAAALQPQLPAPTSSQLLAWSTAPPTTSEEDLQMRERAAAEHRAWVGELRGRGRRLLALPEPEPFWLPHMLDESVDADAAAASSASAAAAIERRRQLWSATRSWSYASPDARDSATSCSDSASYTTTATSSSSSTSSERDAAPNDDDLPSHRNT